MQFCVQVTLETKLVQFAGNFDQKRRPRQRFYWPGINNDIEQMVNNCEKCQQLLPSQPNQPIISTFASYASEQMSIDLFETGGATFCRYCRPILRVPICTTVDEIGHKRHYENFERDI